MDAVHECTSTWRGPRRKLATTWRRSCTSSRPSRSRPRYCAKTGLRGVWCENCSGARAGHAGVDMLGNASRNPFVTNRTRYIVIRGASLASRIADGVNASRDRGWQPFVIPTDSSLSWIKGDGLGAPVLSDHRAVGDSQRAPAPDAVASCPPLQHAERLGERHSNTYPLVTLCAAFGASAHTVAVPLAKHDLAGHPAWLALIRPPLRRRNGDRSEIWCSRPRRAGRIGNRRSSHRSL